MSFMLAGMMAIFFAGEQEGSSSPTQANQGKRIEALVRDLGSDDPVVRDKADQELRKVGKAAEGALKAASESADAEVKRRARAILDSLRVLKVDDQGRVILERDLKGWDVEYCRDQFGNVIKKSWVNPSGRRVEYVRCYAYEAETNRLVQEMDAAGRRKMISYKPNGDVQEAHTEEGFVEESAQVASMPAPATSPARAEK